VLGHKMRMPFAIAPMAMHQMAHSDGELGTIRAAKGNGIVMTLSSVSSKSIEDAAKAYHQKAKACPEQDGFGGKWFQLYVFRDKEITAELVKRAEQCGYTVLVLTVDTPVSGKRESDKRNIFRYPDGIQPGNFVEVFEKAIKQPQFQHYDSVSEFMVSNYDPLGWEDVVWLQSITHLPIVVKGILTPEDAILAARYGCKGVVISNHGGRQLDTVHGTVQCLPEIAKVLKGTGLAVIIDGGIIRGTSIFKALALGADCVMIGRPFLWGLCHSGEGGVSKVIQIFEAELRTAMSLAGCTKVADIHQGLLAIPAHKPIFAKF